MKYPLLVAVLFCSTTLNAEKYYDFNAACRQAYSEIISLRIANGQQLLADEKKAHPDNLIPYFLDNYADFFPLFFNEDIKEFDKKQPLKEARLAAMKIGPKDSPWCLFTQAVLQLQWAAIHIKFGERWAAGWSCKAAYDLVKDNQKLFPNFTPNKMVMGPLQVAAGTIPKGYQWLSNMLGVKGNIANGMKDLSDFINSSDATAGIFKEEAIFYYCYLKFYFENKPADALELIKAKKLDVVNNHLFAYMAANLSLNNQQSAATKSFVLNRNNSASYMASPIWDFELAYSKLYHLEPDAYIYFDRFLRNFKGNFYVKDCWLKLGWYYLLQGNTVQYIQCMDQVKIKGNADTDADKRALKEAKSGKVPHPILLKARLLSDGGYPSEAYEVLKGKSSFDFPTEEDKLEFAYRIGRVYEELGHYDEAVQAYLTTIKTGSDRTEYFAARAALQVAMIYEVQKKNKSMAIAFYNQCLTMENHDYKNSLDQKAKAGVERCSGR
ncbi:MAG: tetratricopeptide repeat protein [Chitinophagaceae bacterium]